MGTRATMRSARLVCAALLVVVPLGAGAPAGAASAPTSVAAAADTPTTLDGIKIVDTRPGMPGGLTRLELRLELSDPDGLPDRLLNFETQPYPVAVASVVSSTSTAPPNVVRKQLYWDQLNRTSGTATSGTWVGTADVTSVSTGKIRVISVAITDATDVTTQIPVANGPSVVVSGSPSLPWQYRVLNAPVKIVNGRERWTPSLRLVRRDDGTPVAGAMTAATDPGFVDVPVWIWSLSVVLPEWWPDYDDAFRLRSSSSGALTLPTYGVQETHYVGTLAGWGSGARRYYTVAATGRLEPPVKWQASIRFATSGGDVELTGSAWPAPSIYAAANRTVHLQRLVGRTWRTEASGRVRDNGRYTVVWDAPPAAGYWVRAYKPGGVEGSRVSVGTTGPAVWVTL
ncbi:hypothetical protein [Cellulomonas composti]|uniref:Uncharacterized protein n=1 Tax=Cellulomonas composti TaxID=266130 RepID=A0A511J9L6_9CELL|nr:hypothetical protein [Cellulomonas composti]GEL94685.1 hypothetical protein CCO02nite_13430 [Cellulomonas composti]